MLNRKMHRGCWTWAGTILSLTVGLTGTASRGSALIVTNNSTVDLTTNTATDGTDVGIDHSLTSLPGGSVPSGTVNLGAGVTWTNTGDLWIASTFNAFTSASGAASVTLAAGSNFTNTGNTRLGVNNWSPGFPTGALDVASGATFTNQSQTYVQRGTLTIEGTANNTNDWSFIGGNQSGSAVATVQGENAVWNSTVNISNAPGSAAVNILEGGTVNGTWGFIGSSGATQTGQATVQGDAGLDLTSTWNVADYISVGEFGATGTLTVNDRGQVNLARMFIGMDGTGAGHVVVNSGGRIAVTPGFFNASTEMWANSTLDLSGGGKMLIGDGDVDAVAPGTVQVGSNGIFKGEGTIHGDVAVTGGTMAPGHSPGTMNITGNLSFGSGGTLLMEVAGTGSGQFDQLAVQGAADFTNGQLTLSFLNGYSPTPEQLVNLSLFSATGGLSGTFSSVSVQGLPADETADVDLAQLSSGQISFVTHVVPEPASAALLALGAALTLLGRRQRPRPV